MHKRIVFKGVIKFTLKLQWLHVCLLHCSQPDSQVANSAADIHQQGPDNIRSNTTKLTTMMYFNQMF